MRCVLAVCVALLAVPISARGPEQTSVTVDLGEPGEVITRVGIDDSKAATGALRVTALTLSVDGEPDQELVVVAGSGRSHYEAIL